MRCFLTGATGFLGSHVAAALLERGDAVTGLTSTRSNADGLEAAGIEPVVGDIRNPGQWVDTATRPTSWSTPHSYPSRRARRDGS